MDLPPPPPPFFRHQHHQHRPRYENVLLPPDFIFPPYTNNLRPPPPPPLPPQQRQPYTLLPPLLPPPPPTPRQIAPSPMPPRFVFSSPSHPIPVRSHAYEIGFPPKPYLHRNFLPHPPPQMMENVHVRLAHDYSDRKPMPQDQIIREGRSNIHGLADSRDWNLQRGARELRSRIPDRGDNERVSYNFCQSRELYDAERRNHNEISGWGRDLYDERGCGEMRPNIVMNNRGSELHKRMDYDGTRQDSIDGWIRGLYRDREHDERRSSKLYSVGNDDGRRLNHGEYSGRLRSGVSEEDILMSEKKMRLQNDVATCRIQSENDFNRDNGGRKCQHLMEQSRGGRSRGEEKEGFEILQTRTNHKREREKSPETLVAEAILAPHCPAVETDINSSIVVTGIPSSIPGSPMFKSSKDVVRTGLLACSMDSQPDSLGTSKEPLKKAVVSEIGSVEHDANDLGVVAVKNQGPIVLEFGIGRTRRNMLKRKKKAKKKLLHETNTEMRKDNGEISNANGCNIPSVSPQPCPAPIDLGEIAVKNQLQEDMKLQGPIVFGSRSARRKRLRKKWIAKKKLLHQTSMVMRKDSGDINSANDCIIPSASPQYFSAASGLGEIDVKYQPQEDMNLHSPTVVGSGSTRGKKRTARKNLDIGCSSQVDRCSTEIQASNASSESLSALLLKPQNAFISDVGSAYANSKDFPLNEVNIPQVVDSEDLDPAMEIDFLGKKGSFKEVGNSIAGLSRVEDPTLELDFDANGSSPSFRKKRKVASPRSNLPHFLEDDMVVDGINSACAKRYQGSTGLANQEAEKKEDLSFSSNNEASACQSENDLICGGEYISNRKPDSPDHNLLPSEKSLQKVASEYSQINTKISNSLPEVNNEVVKKLNLVHGKQTLSKNQLISASTKVFPGHHPLHSSNSRISTNVGKSRTWLRNGISSVAVVDKKIKPSPLPLSRVTKTAQTTQSSYIRKGNSLEIKPSPLPLSRVTKTAQTTQSSYIRKGNSLEIKPSPLPLTRVTKTAQTTQSSYIRKGNSLVRNPSPSPVTRGFHNLSCSVYRLSHCTDSLKNDQAADIKTRDADASSLLRTKLENTSETPCKINDASVERTTTKSPGVAECRGDSGNSFNTHSILEEGNLEKKIIYIRKRSNQLVAASNTDDMSILGVNKSQASSSVSYIKSNKNQLVRASSDNHVKKRDANRNSRRLVPRTILSRSWTKRQSGGVAKSYRHSKFSFVWNLHDMQSSEKDKTSMGTQKVLPNLIPWKRTTYWRSFMHALSTKPNKSSFSISSQTLLLARKRGAMYTRSTHGYSLRMSKILSVGGSSLKWSKAIERDSKKVSEEATRAVAAAVKRKKDGNGVVPIASKSRNNVSSKLVLSVKLHPGERIFRIGSERYKMDPSRRTLHRITAEPEAPSVLQSEKNVKKSYVPRRLLIGNEEYVRIGNGNQLVRDPKRRTRVLASEKVRWSLRTARLRLARKRKYCQFFTRYGKCNKDDGKCPYIHDTSKIAVCTKFLNGLCTNVDCKLTHKVIPERMEDCSYFLKGSCSNENCHYRHVNVNSKSAVCKNFLRGYCADGNECLKKHTYICPTFEATGSCPKESTCKLHHPKKKIEKRQPASEQKSVRGRYFDGGLIEDADISDVSTPKVSVKGKDDIVGFQEGQFPDYISLEVSDMEVDEDDDFDVLV